ncbi:7TM domain-containing protein, partial [Patescibacteria group bacterium]
FVAAQIKEDSKAAVMLAGETLVISLIGFYIASWDKMEYAVMTYPWIVLIVLSFNIFLGKWTGLRLGEYLRFKKILKKIN